MRTHISLNVGNVQSSVQFYEKLFRKTPQKYTTDYAKFDLTLPALNLSLVSSPGKISQVNHFGIEVDTSVDVEEWKTYLKEAGLVDTVEDKVICCYALQDKVWVVDPDGNRWEIFSVLEQLPVMKSLKETGGCCGSSQEVLKEEGSLSETSLCAC